MAVHHQLGLGYGSAAQIAAYTGITYEPVWDTTNSRLIVMTGGGAGLKVALASESYVQAQVGAIAAGAGQIFTQYSSCT